MAGFEYRGHLMGGRQSPGMLTRTIADSETVTKGDAVKLSSGYLAPCDDDDKVMGIVVGLVDKDGIDLSNTGYSLDGTYTEGGIGVETYAAAADNTTENQVQAQIIIDPYALFYNDAAGDMTEAEVGTFFDLTDEDQIKNQSGTTDGAFQLMEVDPDEDDDMSKGLFRIAESGLDPYAQA
jgi:hypothetical protein